MSIRLTASAIRGAIDNLLILLFSSSNILAIVFVVTTSFKFELLILSNAGPDKTPWLTYADTVLAPTFSKASAALVKVPAVSTISSIKIQSFPLTLPIIFKTSETLSDSLLLSTIAKPVLSLFAIYLALTTPPTSGDTIIVFPKDSFL